MARRTLGAPRRASVAVASATFLIASVAAASWTAQSNGNAKAQAGRLQPVTATEASPTGELFPGTSADAALTLTNPNPVAMTVSSIVGNGPITSSSAACDTAGHGVTFADQTGAWEVAKNAALSVSLADAVSMSLDSADACQGASFTIPVTVTGSVSGQGGGGTPTTVAPTTTTSTTQPAQLTWTPANYTYPAADVNTPGGLQSFSLRNTGGAPTNIEMGTLGGPDFVLEGNSCGSSLAPSQACLINVRFRPVQTGIRTGVLQARIANATAQYVTASLSGEGRVAGGLQMTPTSFNFGSVPVGTDSTQVNFQIVNNGTTPANNLAPSIQGDQQAFQIVQYSCPPTLNPSSSCFVRVVFRPARTGSHSAAVTINYVNSTGNRSVQSTLSGVGV